MPKHSPPEDVRFSQGVTGIGVDLMADVREFLSSRRGRLTPEKVGLPRMDDRRRVPGLRREEVAVLANISLDYYVRMERGNLVGVSQGVLEATARALRLTQAERAHLYDLLTSAGFPPAHVHARGRRPQPGRPRGVVRQPVGGRQACHIGQQGCPAVPAALLRVAGLDRQRSEPDPQRRAP